MLVALVVVLPALVVAISTNMPVPPLQWLNITDLVQGTSAPPLRYPSIGYDDSSRTLLLFGGESSSGIPTSQTFLSVHLSSSFHQLTSPHSLDFNTNQWALPAPQANLPTTPPPARYMALGGDDFSSS